MAEFTLVCEGAELSAKEILALENALGESVVSDVPLALEVVFVSEEEIRSLNAQTRGIDKVTDVLSYPTLDGIKGKAIKGAEHPFEMDEEGRLVIGSVAVCIKRAKEQAEEYGHSFERELNYLIVHGAMHCLGYDHMTDDDKAEMREREEFVLTKMGIKREN
jgi:probable rRNA maturation factor